MLALPFNTTTTIAGQFNERFLSGAFREQASDWRSSDVQFRFQHVREFLLATTAAGTLALRSDRDGLYATASLPASLGYVAELIQRGDAAQVSPGFQAIRDEWRIIAGVPTRTIVEARLIEISVCATGSAAYPSTWAAVRREVQRRIRDLNARLENRAGRKLSASSAAAIQEAIDRLSDLLASNTGEDADEEVPPPGLEAEAAGARMTNAEARERLVRLQDDEMHRRLVDLRLHRRYPGGEPPWK